MSIRCQGLVARDQCNAVHITRYTSGRVGYTGAPIPQAIVLHKLVGISAEAYNNQITSPLPKFQCAVPSPSLCQEFPASQNPKSVHFLVTDTGIWQYAELSTTTFGIDYLLGSTWPGLAALLPITDPNGPFIHIAVDSCSADTLIRLLCCIGTELERSLPIITANDLQSDRAEFLLNPGIQTQVDICVASGGFIEQPSLPDIVDDIEELQECCFDNRSDIVVIQQDIINLNQRVYSLEQWRILATEQLASLQSITSVIPTLVEQITVLTNQVTDILNRCCPKKVDTNCFRYQLLPGDEMLVTPNQPVWLNLPTKLEDREQPNCVTGCCGTIVKPGPLWMADLACTECNSCETWDLRATVRFRLANWCAGKKASLYLVACGKKYLLDEKLITMQGPQVVTLTGNFLLPCGCTDVHLLVASSDDKITTAKVVEFAEFRGCCA